MIKLIVGSKGSGKTKAMIDMINAAVKSTDGNVVVVEKGMKLTYDIDHAARLIDLDEYKIEGASMLYGFVAGLLAGNYDITHFFIDNFYKLVEDKSAEAMCAFVKWLDGFSAKENIDFVISMTDDPAQAPEEIKKFLI